MPTFFKATCRDERCADVASPVRHHYQFGPYPVSISSVNPRVMNDYDSLYGHLRVDGCDHDLSENRDDETVPPIRIDMLPQHGGLRLLRRYRICGHASEPHYQHIPAGSLLPHLEWAINREVVQRPGRHLQIHAASLSLCDRGILLSAKSSCGKSTLAAMLLNRGWRYYCDEMSLIDIDTHGLHAYPKAICLKEGAVNLAEAYGIPLRCRNYYTIAFKGYVSYLNPVDIHPHAISPPQRLTHIFLPQYVPGQTEPRLENVSKAQVILELTENLFNRNAFGNNTLDHLSEIVRQAVCYRIFTGHIDRTCSLIEKVVRGD